MTYAQPAPASHHYEAPATGILGPVFAPAAHAATPQEAAPKLTAEIVEFNPSPASQLHAFTARILPAVEQSISERYPTRNGPQHPQLSAPYLRAVQSHMSSELHRVEHSNNVIYAQLLRNDIETIQKITSTNNENRMIQAVADLNEYGSLGTAELKRSLDKHRDPGAKSAILENGTWRPLCGLE